MKGEIDLDNFIDMGLHRRLIIKLNKLQNEIEIPPPAHTKEEWIDCSIRSTAREIELLFYKIIRRNILFNKMSP